MFSFKKKSNHGFSLIEVLVVISISALVFVGLFAAFEYSLKLIAQSRAKMTALSLATDRVEYLRSLPYNDVGTVSGIPNGNVPQNRTVSLNGINFSERVLIEYVDDPADGSGLLDSNSIVADYKKAKVEYTWNIAGVPQSFSLISTIVPRSIETSAGGGTFRVNVFDAAALPLPNIDVRLFNNTGTNTIDVTRRTDATGIALFTGAPAGSGYEFFVSAPGYSSDQTRTATTTMSNPNILPVSVLESDVSTVNFQIDRLSDLTVNVFSAQVTGSRVDGFDDLLGVDNYSDVSASTSLLSLNEISGVYENVGYAVLNPLTPSPAVAWGVAIIEANKPPQTEVRTRFYSSTSTGDLIPEQDLPGNLVGFTGQYIDLSGLALATYPTLVARLELSTTNTSFTPAIENFTINYIESRTMESGRVLNVRGNKVIGLNGLATVYKYDIATTTDSNGQLLLNDIEWDTYLFTLGSGRVVREACSSNPFYLTPDSTKTLNILTTNLTTHNLRVNVTRGDGTPIIGADVDLRLNTSSWNQSTGYCGQVYFGALADSADYELEVSATGFSTQIISSSSVSGTTLQNITLIP
jgi:prepilin-type N-terminal cleavage/methylation domain-containing protein